MPTIKFNAVEEFCSEIENDAPEIDRKIVRTTYLNRVSSASPNIRHIFTICTYSVGGQIVRMDHYCGDVWGIKQDTDREIYDKAETVAKAIEKICTNLDLKVRRGILEDHTP